MSQNKLKDLVCSQEQRLSWRSSKKSTNMMRDFGKNQLKHRQPRLFTWKETSKYKKETYTHEKRPSRQWAKTSSRILSVHRNGDLAGDHQKKSSNIPSLPISTVSEKVENADQHQKDYVVFGTFARYHRVLFDFLKKKGSRRRGIKKKRPNWRSAKTSSG